MVWQSAVDLSIALKPHCEYSDDTKGKVAFFEIYATSTQPRPSDWPDLSDPYRLDRYAISEPSGDSVNCVILDSALNADLRTQASSAVTVLYVGSSEDFDIKLRALDSTTTQDYAVASTTWETGPTSSSGGLKQLLTTFPQMLFAVLTSLALFGAVGVWLLTPDSRAQQ